MKNITDNISTPYYNNVLFTIGNSSILNRYSPKKQEMMCDMVRCLRGEVLFTTDTIIGMFIIFSEMKLHPVYVWKEYVITVYNLCKRFDFKASDAIKMFLAMNGMKFTKEIVDEDIKDIGTKIKIVKSDE